MFWKYPSLKFLNIKKTWKSDELNCYCWITQEEKILLELNNGSTKSLKSLVKISGQL